MAGYNIQSIIDSYAASEDFGFSAVSEEEYNAVIIQKDETVEEYKARLVQIEKLIMPFLTNLLKTADKPYINWPNRKPILEAQIQKILILTRG
jgi:hypothetical protein